MLSRENEYTYLPIMGIRLFIEDKTLVILSEKKLYTLNSSILGDGFRYSKYIINHQVDANYASDNPRKDLEYIIKQIGISSDQAVGMMTAVCINDVFIMHEKDEEISVVAVVTAGTSNAIAAGGREIETFHGEQGTINIILLIDGNLTEGAMVNAVITATEAKTMALHDLKVKVSSTGEVASGTSTDAVVVAVTGQGKELPYAGPATLVGNMIAQTVRKAVFEGVKRYFARKILT